MYILNRALYILNVASGIIDDNIRINYINSLKDTEKSSILIYDILSAAFKSYLDESKSATEIRNIISSEYDKCNLNTLFSDYNIDISPFVECMISEIEKGSAPLERYKSFIAMADSLKNIDMKNGIYNAILEKMVTCGFILTDLDFSNKVTKHLSSADIMTDFSSKISNIVNLALFVPSYNSINNQ